MSNKAGKRGLVPKLRFPEFREAGDWEKKVLREVAAILKKKAGNNKYRLMSITTGVGLVSQLEKFGREIAGAQYKNYLVIEKNDFAYNKSATKEYPEGFIGMYSGNESGAVPNSIFTCFRVDANSVSPKYLDYLFIGNLHGKWLKKFLTVGARAHGSLNIDDNDLLALPVPFPQGDHSLIEQQKIADCLASLDELLTLEAQKLHTLKTHKKGLMQQLFPAEGGTLPKLRFPEFRDAGEWEKKRLGEALTFQAGFPFDSASFTEDCSGLRLIRNRDLKSDDKIIFYSKSFDEKFVVNNGDVLVGMDGDFTPCVWNKGKALLNQRVGRMLPNSNSSQRFLFYFLTVHLRAIEEATARTTVKHLSHSDVERIHEPLPALAEQKKIGDCLASLDDLITAQTQKLAALKTHKKGLMQQLFPALDEVAA